MRLVIGGLVLLLCRGARAEPRRSFSLEYRAETGCASEMPLLAELGRRAPAAERALTGVTDVDAVVTVLVDAAGVQAQVTVRRADGVARRDVRGASCEEVARAVAFIIALALDPDEALTDDSSAPSSAQPPNDGPEEREPAARVPAAAPAAQKRAHRPASVTEHAVHPLRFGAGVLTGVTSGVAPEPAFALGAFLELEKNSRAWFAARFRLSAFRAARDAATQAGIAELELFSLRAAACPVAFGPGHFAELCATFDVGRLRGQGKATLDPKTSSAPWYGPGAAVHAGTRALRVLTLGAELGVVAPLARDRFLFAPGVLAHRIPPAAASALVTVGFAWPS